MADSKKAAPKSTGKGTTRRATRTSPGKGKSQSKQRLDKEMSEEKNPEHQPTPEVEPEPDPHSPTPDEPEPTPEAEKTPTEQAEDERVSNAAKIQGAIELEGGSLSFNALADILGALDDAYPVLQGSNKTKVVEHFANALAGEKGFDHEAFLGRANQ